MDRRLRNHIVIFLVLAAVVACLLVRLSALQRNHVSLKGKISKKAAPKDELAANDLDLAKAGAQVKQLAAARQEFEHGVKLDDNRTSLQVEQLRGEIAALEEKVRDGRIVAPADGTLYSLGRTAAGLPLKAGDYVKVGDLLAEIADLHKVRVRAFIHEPEVGGLEPGAPVRITRDALPNPTWMGKTQVIPKQVVARGPRSVGELLCEVDNQNLELLPNVNVNVRIKASERVNVLTVPRGAVEAQDGRRFVLDRKSTRLNSSHT